MAFCVIIRCQNTSEGLRFKPLCEARTCYHAYGSVPSSRKALNSNPRTRTPNPIAALAPPWCSSRGTRCDVPTSSHVTPQMDSTGCLAWTLVLLVYEFLADSRPRFLGSPVFLVVFSFFLGSRFPYKAINKPQKSVPLLQYVYWVAKIRVCASFGSVLVIAWVPYIEGITPQTPKPEALNPKPYRKKASQHKATGGLVQGAAENRSHQSILQPSANSTLGASQP